jgi:hypothetical protein
MDFRSSLNVRCTDVPAAGGVRLAFIPLDYLLLFSVF